MPFYCPFLDLKNGFEGTLRDWSEWVCFILIEMLENVVEDWLQRECRGLFGTIILAAKL